MGELGKRGNVWVDSVHRNGKRYEESSGSEKKDVAIELLRIREGDSAKGLPVTPKIARLKFDEAAADVVNDYKTNGKRMSAITTADLRAFIVARLEAGASNAEINRELAIVKRSYRLAIQAGKLLHSPYVPMLAERNVRQGVLRARGLPGRQRGVAGGATSHRDVRLPHRLAGPV